MSCAHCHMCREMDRVSGLVHARASQRYAAAPLVSLGYMRGERTHGIGIEEQKPRTGSIPFPIAVSSSPTLALDSLPLSCCEPCIGMNPVW